MAGIKRDKELATIQDVEDTDYYRQRVQSDERYIGDKLLQSSRQNLDILKRQIKNKKIDIVVVSPQFAAIQTCLELFGEEDSVEIIVEPLLNPRLDSSAAIPVDIESMFEKFRAKPSFAKSGNRNWFLELSQSYDVNEEVSNPQRYCLQIIKESGAFETRKQYNERNLQLRHALFDLSHQSKKKVAVIGHPLVLMGLTATGWYEDWKWVNPSFFDHAQIKNEYVWIEGVEAEAEETIVPICGR